jgi:hypothetical protein
MSILLYTGMEFAEDVADTVIERDGLSVHSDMAGVARDGPATEVTAPCSVQRLAIEADQMGGKLMVCLRTRTMMHMAGEYLHQV